MFIVYYFPDFNAHVDLMHFGYGRPA